jgi:hypothetical protein
VKKILILEYSARQNNTDIRLTDSPPKEAEVSELQRANENHWDIFRNS